MKKNSYISFIFCCLITQTTFAQDKLFLRNNTTLFCKIASINEKTVSYRDSVGATQITTISKENIIMAEYKTGEIYVFGKAEATSAPAILNETSSERKARKMQEWKKEDESLRNNIIGFEPIGFFIGRFGASYERLLNNKNIGIKIPMLLSYNFLGDSSNKKVGFITGLDVNFYQDLKPNTKYFFGPRVRYGTDMFLGNIEGITAQLNNGIFVSRGKSFTNTIGLGFGFFKFTRSLTNTNNTINGGTYDYKKLYPSFSITWRLGFRL